MISDDESLEATGVSRRAFLVRSGQLAAGLTIGAPALDNVLRSTAFAQSLRDVPPHADIAALHTALRWRLLGPFRGGRVAAATGVPGRPHEFYFGAVNGGVWKTIDGGRIWTPIFDAQPVASIGAIAVAPSAVNTIYVGTGESTPRDSMGFGNGMYKSTDAGRTWLHIGLGDTQHIGKIAVDPHNPNVLFVAAMGHFYAPNTERGVFRSVDGGRSWQKVLYKNEHVGAVEVVIDPSNSKVIYAGLWNSRRPPWFTYAPTNGPGGGIYKSTDGGTTWKQLTTGLPAAGIGRTGIAVAPTNPRRVYAVVDCLVPESQSGTEPPLGTPPPPPGTPQPGRGGVFRSDNGGESWTRMSNDAALWGRGWYFSKVTVDPRNADRVYVPNVAVNRSSDGGKTWEVLRGSPGGDDYHQAWISPTDSSSMIVASDQGAIITRNATDDPRVVTWSSWLNQPTAQLYHISVDPRFPYWVTGAQQDSGAVAVRSRGKFAQISTRDWEPTGPGGESDYTAGDPLHPGILFGGSGQRYDLETNLPVSGTTEPKSPEPARSDWTRPLVISRADRHAMYFANQFMFKTTDGARTWTQISADLTRADIVVPATLDATAAAHIDRNGKRGVIYTIAPSPVRAPLVWAGTDDGLIHVTQDDGKNWQNVTPAAVTPWSRITMMEASHFDASSAYASVDRHQLQDFDPYVYRTRDLGKSWQRITNGLPSGVYVHTIKEDSVRRGLLFAGTERGVFTSLDDGDSWHSLQLNLPVTSMRDFEVYGDDLIVGTHGRGIWVIDDLSPLRQLTDDVTRSGAHLFKPADVTHVAPGDDNGTPYQKDEPQAENPAGAAYIDYYLREASTTPVTLEIVEASGRTVKTFSSSPAAVATPANKSLPRVSPIWRDVPLLLATSAGAHRVPWTAMTESPGNVRDFVPAPLLGVFTARLTVNGKRYEQSFIVKPDPRLRTT